MRRFVLQTILFLVLLGLTATGLVFLANGATDNFYLRFTSPRQTGGLVLGTSRAAQGLRPDVLGPALDAEIYNFAFTIAQSPYGPTYLDAIERKLAADATGPFLLAVDPWSVSSTTEDPNDSMAYRELDLCLGNTRVLNMDPNPFYLANNLGGSYHSILFPDRRTVLHEDGWLEVNVPMDEVSVAERTARKVLDYTGKLETFTPSTHRRDCLVRTIDRLRSHGPVVLVRLPIDPAIMRIEDQYMADFDDWLAPAISSADAYIDMTDLNDSVDYTDGNHIHSESAVRVSQELADRLLRSDLTACTATSR